MVLGRTDALRIADLVSSNVGADDPSPRPTRTLRLDQTVEVSCRCDRVGCGGAVRFVTVGAGLVTGGPVEGRCLRCGSDYRLLAAMTELTPVAEDSGPAAHRLLNAAAAAVDAVRAARSDTAPDDTQTAMLLGIAERRALAVVEGLRELILGLPIGTLHPREALEE